MWLLPEFPGSELCQKGPPPPQPSPSLGKGPWNQLHLRGRLWTNDPEPRNGPPLPFP